MRALVTGATGFIGRHLVKELAGQGHEVVSSSRSPTGPVGATLHVAHDLGSAEPFPDVGALDAIVHLAGRSSVQDAIDDPIGVAQVNVQGTLRMLLLARRLEASFILASSQRVYERGPEPRTEDAPKLPTDLYGCTKLAAELYTESAGRLFGISGAILRPFSVYGPGQMISYGTSGVISILAQKALAGEPLVVMSRQRRDFVEVTDAVTGIIQALDRPRCPPTAYNIGVGLPTSIRELAESVRDAAGSRSGIVEDYSQEESGDLVADISRARHDLSYAPRVTLERGLHTYVDWLRSLRPHPA